MKERILIVEDNLETRTLLLTYLRIHGYDVWEAESGQEGLLWYHCGLRSRNPVRLILLDAALPDIEGFAVARNIRNLEEFGPSVPKTKIIMYTAYDNIVSLSTLPETVRIDGYISKLEPPDSVLKVIRMHLDEEA